MSVVQAQLEYAREDVLGPMQFRGKTYTIPVVHTSKNGHNNVLFRAMDLAAVLTGVDGTDAPRKFNLVQERVAQLTPKEKLMEILNNGDGTLEAKSYYYSWKNKEAVALTMDGAELFIQNCNSGQAHENRQALLELLRAFKNAWSGPSSSGKRERVEDDQDDLLDRDLKRLNSMISMVKATDNDQDKLASLSNDVMAVNKRWQAMMTSHILALPAPVREPSPPCVQDRLLLQAPESGIATAPEAPTHAPVPTPIQPRLLLQAPELLQNVQAKGLVVFEDSFMSAIVNACLNENKAIAVKEITIKLDCLYQHYKAMAKRDGCKVIKTKERFRWDTLFYWNGVNRKGSHSPYKINVVMLLKDLQENGKYHPDATLPEKMMV